MAAVNRVYAARLAGMVVLGPDGESIGRVRDVVISISIVRQQPRVLGLVIELLTRRRIFVPILRVTAIEPSAVTLTTGNVSLRRFAQRPGEVLVLGQVLDTRVRVERPGTRAAGGRRRRRRRPRHRADPHPRLGGHQGRGARPQRRLGRRGTVHVVDWQHVARPHAVRPGACPARAWPSCSQQFEGQRADRGRRRHPGAACQAPPRGGQRARRRTPRRHPAGAARGRAGPICCGTSKTERAADVLEAMDPDDAADLLGELTPADAERCCAGWTPRTPSRSAGCCSTPPTPRAA